jgi:hypothetical protein
VQGPSHPPHSARPNYAAIGQIRQEKQAPFAQEGRKPSQITAKRLLAHGGQAVGNDVHHTGATILTQGHCYHAASLMDDWTIKNEVHNLWLSVGQSKSRPQHAGLGAHLLVLGFLGICPFAFRSLCVS